MRVMIVALLAVAAAPAQLLEQIDVSGPAFIVEGGQGQFRATAIYDDNSTQDVTADAVWTVTPATTGMFVAPGLLQADPLAGCSSGARVQAAYGEGWINVSGIFDTVIRENGLAGTMLQFDGDDDFTQVPDSGSLDLGQQATIELWIYANGFGGRFLSKEDGQACGSDRSIGWGMIGETRTTGIEFFLGDRGAEPCPGYVIVSAPDLIELGRWIHLAVVLDSMAPFLQMFRDGQLVAETQTNDGGDPIPPWPVRNSTLPFWLGGNPLFPDTFARIILDEVRVWNVARTADEIRGAMFTPISASEPGLIGCWRLDAGSGQTIDDLSPFANHGQLGTSADPDCSDPAWLASHAPIGSTSIAPTIPESPPDLIVRAGQTTEFQVDAAGTSLTYQWRKEGIELTDGNRISGATTATLTIAETRAGDSGLYDAVVSNECAMITSQSAALTVSCNGEITGDDIAGLDDLAILLSNFGQTGQTYSDGDLDGDGDVDISDLAAFLSAFGIDCE